MKKILKTAPGFITIVLITVLIHQNLWSDTKETDSWIRQLDEMNQLIMKTSGINIIYGLSLSKNQAIALKSLCEQVKKISPTIPDMTGDAVPELKEIRKNYLKLARLLEKKKPITEDFKNTIFRNRIKEAEIITKSVNGKPLPEYKNRRCISCHVPPSAFPSEISSAKKDYSKAERLKIDRAHVKGLFGHEGMMKLWQIKASVDAILTTGQKFMLKDFTCCLIPPEGLKNSSNIGQAAVTDEWLGYLKDIREIDKNTWPSVKYLYIVPFEDLVKAQYPGIPKKDKTAILKKIDRILEKTRQLDRIDFALTKKQLCREIHESIQEYSLVLESTTDRKLRQYEAAVFLLLPENCRIYDIVIQNQ